MRRRWWAPRLAPGMSFPLQVSEPIIWLGPVPSTVAARFPQTAELIVRVQDTQGRPADGVPVTFDVEPAWVRSVSISPSQTSTQGGIARTTFFEPQTIGVVRVMAHVDTMTAQARITVQTYEDNRHKAE